MQTLIDATFDKLSGQRFALGRTVMTPGALELPIRDVLRGVARHARGDWGDVSADDKAENDFSVDKPLRILSAYHASNGVKFWIITEADRSATTVLLPEEY